ncbi:hypothetical protein [Hymenobacter sp. B1770]|uniref:hypothetical protein n=1 Tax=Hymenobacter sp. B1770 TaxID=1718788 RepID=UPI003CEA6F4A
MRQLYLLVFCLLASSAPAQILPGAHLTGQVLDEQRRPVEFANIVLVSSPDSAVVAQGTDTDALRKFVLERVPCCRDSTG